MQDPVAEVLERRAALDRGIGGGVALSLLAHALATALGVYAAMHQEPPMTASIVNIKFAPIAQPAAPPKSATPHLAAPQPATAPKPLLQEPHPVLQQPKTKPAAKPEPKTVPFSPFGRSTKKGSENAPPPPPPAAPTAPSAPAGAVGADVPVGGAGVVGLEGGDFPYTIYIERMRTLIGAQMFRGQVAPGISATVHFRIERDGTIHDVTLEASSGNGTFDRAAQRAVLAASPLPPLPFAYNGTSLGVRLVFK
jgi:TonB family protein